MPKKSVPKNPVQKKSANKNLSNASKCACGSSRKYIKCCGQYIKQGIKPLTAEVLMRSRYCAYVLQDEEYLLTTWLPSTRPAQLNLQHDNVEWTQLEILATSAGKPLDNTGTVEFIAYYKGEGQKQQIHEVSQFVKEHNQWLYVDGLIH